MHNFNWVKHGQITVVGTVLEKSPQNLLSVGKYSRENIGKIGSMFRDFMRAFDAPTIENYGTHKWCIDLHNISSYKILNGRHPLEII